MLTLNQQLDYCKKCQNRQMDFQKGILCSLTNNKPKFEKTCKDFILDEKVRERESDDAYILTSKDIKDKVSDKLYKRLILEQNVPAAVIVGFLTSVLGAVIWALLTIATGLQIGIMALGIGALVGIFVRIYGKGITIKFGVIGAIFSLFGCVLGNLMSSVALISEYYEIGFWSVFSQLTMTQIIQIMIDWFEFVDIIF